MGQIILSY